MSITGRNPVGIYQLSFLFSSCFLTVFCHAASEIAQGQSIRDGAGQTLISEDRNFVLGFFSPENSSSRFVGIWHNGTNPELYSVVWVANRRSPISDKSGVLRIGDDGNLVVFDGKNDAALWSSNASIILKNTTAKLKNEGNLILFSNEDHKENVYWESFNHPADTYLPAMRVEVNAKMGETHIFTSWKSANDPSPGNYSMGVDPRASPQIVIWEGKQRRWRSGYWDGQIFSGVADMTGNYMYGFVLSQKDQNGSRHFTYSQLSNGEKLRFRITWNGYEEQLKWVEDNGKEKWSSIFQSQPANDCDFYSKCGAFGICSAVDSPICRCMKGFTPRYADQWRRGNWSAGCIRETQLNCRSNLSGKNDDGDEFSKLDSTKLPDFTDLATLDSKETCEKNCLQNCNCTAYAFETGIGCMIWKGDLVDVQHFAKGGGKTLLIRLANSEVLGGKTKLSTLVILIIIAVAGVLLFVILFCCLKTKLKVLPTVFSIACWKYGHDIPIFFEQSKSRELSPRFSGSVDLSIEGGDQANMPELPIFNFNCLLLATNYFSEENKLGEGGFGTVYKGKLPGEQEIAVKRLSRRSGQGFEEFKTEIILIAKLQHRNLVRLLGCCIQGEEKMLIYEYMQNKSLDYFLFDKSKQAILLDWRKRITIIEGIARGLLYLHRDSRLRIIHRDLKASNILLDKDMNPKISDFGLARLFGGNQHEAKTNRVVGTYGYMSPEYAMKGLFSMKSDVYSFGVLLLEIVTGRRNSSFDLSKDTSLVEHVWQLWNEEKAMELVDPSIRDSCSEDETLRCVHLGLLCVQDSPAERPTMSSVLLMLESEAVNLRLPRQPTFSSMRGNSLDSESLNELTATVVFGR